MKYLDNNTRGKFIVIYGPNNVGKSTQFGLLASKLTNIYHKQILFLKYPIYELNPTGPFLYNYLRGGDSKKIAPVELQELYAQNRRDFQPIVETCLKSGIHVIAEDYIGTGLAWGMTYWVKFEELLKINNYLLEPDLSLVLIGKRFTAGIEEKHVFENAGDEIWLKNLNCYKQLAKKFGWKVIKSDDSVEKVNSNIMKVVAKELNLD